MSTNFGLAFLDKQIILNVAKLSLKYVDIENFAFRSNELVDFGLPRDFVNSLPQIMEGYIQPLIVLQAIVKDLSIYFNDRIAENLSAKVIVERLETYFAERAVEIVYEIVKQLRREQEDWLTMPIPLRASLIRAEILQYILNFPESRVWPSIRAEIEELCQIASDRGWK